MMPGIESMKSGARDFKCQGGGLAYQTNATMAITIPAMRKAIKIQIPVDLKKDWLSSSFRRHSRRPQLLRQQSTLFLLC